MAESGVNWLKFPELDEAGDTSINKKTMRKDVRDKMFSCKGVSSSLPAVELLAYQTGAFLKQGFCDPSSRICEHRQVH